MESTNQKIKLGIMAPCPPPYGGVTRIIENHLSHWSKDAIESHVIPNYPPEKPESYEEASYHPLPKTSPKTWKGMSHYATCLSKAPLTRPWVYKRFVEYNRALAKLIEDSGINVLYAHQVWPAGASAVLQSKIHKIPSVVVAYGETYHTTQQHKRQSRIERYTLSSADWVISTSQHCLDGALKVGASKSKSSVINAGIDLDRFKPTKTNLQFRKDYGIPEDATVISVLGLALRRKLDTLLDALEKLEPKNEIHCLIGGVGSDLDYVKDRASKIRNVKVHIMGFVPESALPDFYSATDILVVSPRTKMECMGQSMKEAMACSRAVVGARIGGVEEAVVDGENGLLFESDNPTELAKALNELSDNQSLREKMGSAGRKIAETKFNAMDAAEKTLNIFNHLLD